MSKLHEFVSRWTLFASSLARGFVPVFVRLSSMLIQGRLLFSELGHCKAIIKVQSHAVWQLDHIVLFELLQDLLVRWSFCPHELFVYIVYFSGRPVLASVLILFVRVPIYSSVAALCNAFGRLVRCDCILVFSRPRLYACVEANIAFLLKMLFWRFFDGFWGRGQQSSVSINLMPCEFTNFNFLLFHVLLNTIHFL